VEQAVHDAGAARVGQQLALVADQAARRRVEHETRRLPPPDGAFDHLGLALARSSARRRRNGLVDVDHDFLDRLQRLAGPRHPSA
jgi:hypothetical protein